MVPRNSAGPVLAAVAVRSGVLVGAHDLLFVLLIVVVFAFIALCARGLEKL